MKKFFLYILISLPFFSIHGETLIVHSAYESVPLGKYMKIYRDYEKNLSAFEVYEQINKGKFDTIRGNHINEAFHNCIYWLYFDIHNIDQNHIDLLIEAQTPDVNELQYYVFSHNEIIDSSFITGDYYPYDQRHVDYRNFVYPLSFHNTGRKQLLIRIDTYGEPLLLPLVCWKKIAFIEKIVDENILYGLYFGMIIIFIIITFIVWLLLMNKMNLYYMFYLIFIFLFLFNTKGLGYQYLWPEWTKFNHVSTTFFIGIAAIFQLLFAVTFLELKRNYPYFYKSAHILTYIIALFSFSSLFLLFFKPVLLKISLFSYLGSLIIAGLFLLYISIRTIVKYKEPKYTMYFVVYLMVVTAFIVYFLRFLGIINETFFNKNIVFFVVYIEMLVFSSYLAYNVFKVRNINSILQLELAKQRDKASHGILFGEEKERRRLSEELHDGLGLLLSMIKNKITGIYQQLTTQDQEKINPIITDLDIACRDVRNLSHNLSPVSLEIGGLIPAIQSSVSRLNNATKTTRFIFKHPESLVLHEQVKEIMIFRICQELLNNAYKYAQASEVLLSMNVEYDKLYILIRDNGKGFDTENKSKWGIGFSNIKSRLNYLKGHMELNSRIHYGTLVTIEIPLN